jgi:membrane fusion protein (multidrug efflux system)
MKYSIYGRLLIIIIVIPFSISCNRNKMKIPPIPEIPVVEVLQKDVPVYREFVGEVFGEKDIPIRARVEGFLEGIYFEEGFKVKQGQLLYTIDPEPLEARVNAQQSKVAEAETMLAKAKSDLERYKPLAEKNAVSKSDLDAAQAQYDAALSNVEAAKANLKSAQIELGYTKIYSPITGIIGKTKAKVGDFVGREPNPVILNTVSETNNVKVNFFLTEKEYLYIIREFQKRKKNKEIRDPSRGQEVLELILSDGSVYEQMGTVDFIDRGVDASTGSMLVQGNFPNPDGILRPGLFAKVKVEMDVKENATLIPQRCVMELQGQFSVFVVSDSNKVEARTIVPGEKIGDLWLVEKGLKAGEEIVIDALQKVRSDMIVSPVIIDFKSQTPLQ